MVVVSESDRLGKIIGPDGETLTLENLPPPNTKRWVIRRKAEVVAAVRGGLISLEEACKRYTLSTEEFISWQRAIEQYGLPGLRATRLQDYREPSEEPEVKVQRY
jgi:hypothetical protein